MSPYEGNGGMALTMDMLVSEPVYQGLMDVEEMIIEQRGAREVPFPGMDKSGRGVCLRNEMKACLFGPLCPLRHIIKDKQVVCKHWLRGLCKKGDQCEFLHEYDLSKMPECFFFSKYMACSNKECPFRHIDPESKIKDCPWYDRGFCRHGPFCKHRHRRRIFCPLFLLGFCPEGPNCKFTHPSFNLPAYDPRGPVGTKFGHQSANILCHNCHERGHKATNCPHLPTQTQLPQVDHSRARQFNQPIDYSFLTDKKNLADVTCYKCGEKGHYANRCHKGVLAFLSNTAHLAMEQREKDQNDFRIKAETAFSTGNPAQSDDAQEN
ncbi:zinc finger c-x8-C-x5-C-x3-H type (and similar) domain-containing protein [Ditylenchus destructor]|uniref:Cleavage and polyadenylation specificity factor subunit 4 n=1 Tax=Ditylenchus destructor TaxID=166010 RepID=A0AAD4R4I9_9BILA|nr:zinc finger c-x8-C-x5-C-x3-H type (and similar) domain-containing protein [Ditylenchus destructor]